MRIVIALLGLLFILDPSKCFSLDYSTGINMEYILRLRIPVLFVVPVETKIEPQGSAFRLNVRGKRTVPVLQDCLLEVGSRIRVTKIENSLLAAEIVSVGENFSDPLRYLESCELGLNKEIQFQKDEFNIFIEKEKIRLFKKY